MILSYKLRLDAVAKRYGNVHALLPFSLAVLPGEFVTLLGPSGSGKTTILNILAGLLKPDQGTVWIGDVDATHLSPHRRDIGLVFQNYALFPHLSVFENIAFPLRMRGVTSAEIRTKVERILEVVRLPHTASRLPRELSGGQQQRIALARCAVYEPSIILMDEPLGALDKSLRDDLQLEIRRLHKDLGATVLYVTHDQGEAMSMSDRICLMNGGKVEQIGTPEDLYFNPSTIFAAGFLGSANFFEGVLSCIDQAGVQLRTTSGETVRAGARGNGLAVGQAAAFAVRPEHVVILQDGDKANNELMAVVESRILLGNVQRYLCRLPDGGRIECQSLSDRSAAATAGSPVRLGWASQNTLVFPHKGR